MRGVRRSLRPLSAAEPFALASCVCRTLRGSLSDFPAWLTLGAARALEPAEHTLALQSGVFFGLYPV